MLYLYSTPMHMYTQLHSLGQKLIFGPSLISALICADGRNWAITYKIIRGITKICYLTREIDIPIIVDYLLDTHSMMMSMHTLQISCIRLLSKREMVHNNANLFWRTFFKIYTMVLYNHFYKKGHKRWYIHSSKLKSAIFRECQIVFLIPKNNCFIVFFSWLGLGLWLNH